MLLGRIADGRLRVLRGPRALHHSGESQLVEQVLCDLLAVLTSRSLSLSMSERLLVLVESRTHLVMNELQLPDVMRLIGLQPGLDAVTDAEDILPTVIFLKQNIENFKCVSEKGAVMKQSSIFYQILSRHAAALND